MSDKPVTTSFFIEKDIPRTPPARGAKPLRLLLTFLLTAFYLIVLSIIVVVLKNGGFSMASAGAVFLLGILGGIGVQFFITLYSRSQNELSMLLDVLEGSRGARLITDPDDNSVYTNLRFNHLVESAGTPSLETLTGLFAQDDTAAKKFQNLAAQARDGKSESVELPTQLGGKDAWLQITAQPIRGWPGYIHWRLDDITTRYEMEHAVRTEQEKLFDFTDNAPVGFFSVDENGKFLFANQTLAQWLGVTVRDLIKTQDKVLHDFIVDLSADTAAHDLCPEGGAQQKLKLMLRAQDGRVFHASVKHAVVFSADGKVRTRSIVHDLTSEQDMQKALQESEDRFQRLFEEAPLGICMLDTDGKISECNHVFAEVVGLADQPPVGNDFVTLIDDSDQVKITEWLARVREGKNIARTKEIALKGSGERVVQLYARRFKGSKNLVLHFIDLTAQRALEMQFNQSQKMQAVGQLAGGIAHDFNNLLTAMIGFCDLLLLRHKPGDPSFADIMQIKQNSNRAANLVRQLLAFSRQQTLQPRTLDMADVLTELSHLLRRLIGANIELNISHGSDLGLVRVDQGQLEQVLINLVVNARDAMISGGTLTVSTENYISTDPQPFGDEVMPPGDWVLIRVVDTGSGIAKDVQDRIFEPFFTTKGPGAGTGLGLSTVYGIVRQTGGFIRVESKVDEGTVFSIYLPHHVVVAGEDDAIEQAEEVEDETRDLTGSARILLVEDEDAVRAFSARALSNKGYDVLQAASGEEALSIFQAETTPIDLIVTDVVMPHMDGPTLAAAIRQTHPDLKIIFMSGYTEDRFKDQMDENIYFLAKPFTLRSLAAKVKEILEK